MSPAPFSGLVRKVNPNKLNTTNSPDPSAAAPVAERRPARGTSQGKRGSGSTLAVMAVATGMIATVGLPAYAFAPGTGQSQNEATATTEYSHAQAQHVEVAEAANSVTVARDAYTATTEQELADARAAAASAEAEKQRAAIATQFASYESSGPSVADFLANPPYPNFDLGSVYSVAAGYQGVPYVFGGATPAGFDCSGFIMYVYAQFGVSLPHSSNGQGAAGTVISEADAQPGDLVIMEGHDGFYAGNGNILHAPYEGASVRVQPIWTSDYYIVRIGI